MFAFVFSGVDHRIHSFLEEGGSRPTNPHWDPNKMVSRLVYEMQNDGFYKKLQQKREEIKKASLTELEHIDLESKKLIGIYERLLKKTESLEGESEEVKALLIEIRSRLVLAIALQQSVTKRLNDSVFSRDLEALSKEPELGDKMTLPNRIWQLPERPVIEPK